MKKELIEELRSSVIEYSWEDKNLIIRALFTTLVYMEDMFIGDATKILLDLYKVGAIEDLDISYEEFEKFMLEDIKKQL